MEINQEETLQDEPSRKSKNGLLSRLRIGHWLGRRGASKRQQRPPPPVPDEPLPSPEPKAGFWSALTFGWLTPLMRVGHARPLERNDIWAVAPQRQAAPLAALLAENLLKGRQDQSSGRGGSSHNNNSNDNGDPRKGQAGLATAIYLTFRREVVLGGACRLVADVVQVMAPFALRYLIEYAALSYSTPKSTGRGGGGDDDVEEPRDGHRDKGVALAAGIVLMMVLQSLAMSHCHYLGGMVGAQVRAAMISLIFAKSFRVSQRARKGGGVRNDDVGGSEKTGSRNDDKIIVGKGKRKSKNSTSRKGGATVGCGWDDGRIMNLISTDVSRVEQACSHFHVLWTTPIALLITLATLVVNIQWSALAGFALLLVSIPLLTAAMRFQLSRRKALNSLGDSRIALTQELFRSIRFVKFFGWEASFLARVRGIRVREVKLLRTVMSVRICIHTVALSLPIFASVLSFVAYSLSGHDLDAARVFSCVALFNCLRNQLSMLPQALGMVVDAWSSVQRIQVFLLAEERASVPVVEGLRGGGGNGNGKDDDGEYGDDDNTNNDSNNAVVFDNATFEWDLSPPPTSEPGQESGKTLAQPQPTTLLPFSLKSINLSLRKGELLAIVGPVGAGKTALLSALTGEMRRVSGSVRVITGRNNGQREHQHQHQQVATCPERPWIQNATARENILFGRPLDPPRYCEVVRACALQPDFDVLPRGDETEIGERGVTLSGGQKQRLSLARAIYSDAEVVLLDDPLSAVDSHVGEHIFEEAVRGLLAGKSRILATHQRHVLGRCDRVVWLEDGAVRDVDTFEALRARHAAFGEVLSGVDDADRRARRSGGDVDGPPPQSTTMATTVTSAKAMEQCGVQPPSYSSSSGTAGAGAGAGAGEQQPRPPAPIPDSPSALMQDEDRAVKAVHRTVYLAYISAAGSRIHAPLILALLVAAQGSMLATSLWLAFWVSGRFDGQGMALPGYLGIYVGLGTAQFVLFYAYGYSLASAATRAGDGVFKRALAAILGAPMRFFETNPAGRLLNRCARDVDAMDTVLVEALRLFLMTLAIVTSVLILVVVFYQPFVAAVVPGCAFVVWTARYYRPSARELKRHEAVLRSVVFARFSEALSGVASIRAYKREASFLREVDRALDDMDAALFLTVAGSRWLSVRLDCVGNLLLLVTSMLVATTEFKGSVDPSIAGMLMSLLLPVVQLIQVVARQWAELENAMNATERLHYYGTEIEQEEKWPAPPTLEGKGGASRFNGDGSSGGGVVEVPASWPSRGEVIFDKIQMRYRPGLPLVLDGFTLHVRPGEHVGIVGRTGSGKSSVVASLFRHANLSGGSITIDGVDAGRVRLADLRSRMSIIPQDPTLFKGTVRENLDPFGRHADLDLWNALRQSGFAVGEANGEPSSTESSSSDGNNSNNKTININNANNTNNKIHLDDRVDEDGSNFSLGQRQLLALARALVRSSQIIVCDEATSSVDAETDAAVQRTIRTAFKDRTLLCIAHRLQTVLEYDRVCVMDGGRIVEIGRPLELFDGDSCGGGGGGVGGVFRGMCEKGGISRKDFPCA